jgi:dihydroxyacid dehydratase/phosphogluconate dehydratase
MTAMAEALGMTLPGASSIPAMDAAHPRMAADCGERIVAMIGEDLTPQRILTRGAFLNAVAVQMALGGSTNAAVHILAMAGRAGVALTLDDLDAVARRVPVLANLFPSGDKLMEDFYYAGGLPALMARLSDLLSLDETTASGRCTTRSARTARWPCCAATWRPKAPSSSPVPPTRPSSGTAAARWSSTASRRCWRRWPTPISTSTKTPCWCCAMPARWVRRACPNGATCRCRRSCCSAACATCCASATRA